MNIEQLRAEFEAWANGRCELHLVNPAGRYSSATTQFAWEAYQAGRAALQSQDRGAVIEEGFRWRSINPPYKIWNYVWDRAPDSWELREAEIQNVVVYARRVEGERE
jgi:hypothetical protein